MKFKNLPFRENTALTINTFDPLWHNTRVLLPLVNKTLDVSDNAVVYTNVTIGAPSHFGFNTAHFNGSASLVNNSNTITPFGTGDFTIEMWIYPTTSPSTFSYIYDTRGNVPSLTGIGLMQAGTQIRIDTNIPNAYLGGTFILNTWQHLAVVRHSNTITAYINGVVQFSSSFALNLTTGISQIGGSAIGSVSNGFSGFISDFRLSNVARYLSTFNPPDSIFAQH